MTLAVDGPARQPRRWGLYGPFILLALGMLVWSGYWVSVRRTTLQVFERAVTDLRAGGTQVQWRGQRLDGFPFRLTLTLTDLQVTAPDGWSLASPRLEAEAYLHSPDNWVLAAPAGLELGRPGGVRFSLTGKTLHGSLFGLAQGRGRLSLEGLDVSLSGQTPGALTDARRIQLYVRPGPKDQAAVLFRLDGGLSGGKPVDLALEGLVTRASQIRGRTWTEAMQTWRTAGGRVELKGQTGPEGRALVAAVTGP